MTHPSEPLPPVRKLIPHIGDMVLLDSINKLEVGIVDATVDLSKPSIFHNDAGLVPTYVGIEYIIQAASALAGAKRFLAGLPPLIGLLLGSRLVTCTSPYFPKNCKLQISVRSAFVEEPIGVFDGSITQGSKVYVTGQVKAVQPRSPAELQNMIETVA